LQQRIKLFGDRNRSRDISLVLRPGATRDSQAKMCFKSTKVCFTVTTESIQDTFSRDARGDEVHTPDCCKHREQDNLNPNLDIRASPTLTWDTATGLTKRERVLMGTSDEECVYGFKLNRKRVGKCCKQFRLIQIVAS
jgi:hypothetical protein